MRPTFHGAADPSGVPGVPREGITVTSVGAPEEALGEVGMLVAVLYPGSASRRARAIVREVLLAEGLPGDDVTDTEAIAAELAANCERHACPPYEIRVFSLAGVPAWCELVDGDPDLGWIPAILDHSRPQTAPDPLAESGRGLLLVRELSRGYCRAYPTTTFTGDAPAKAVAFALPTRWGTRLTCPPLLHLGRRSARLHREP
ncbi:ATP-binding protein [Streptosporangium sp. NBC_01810]|uniref:ATP-binding protein n=1 Tax=Streptosporangium sp. NBC_01810 TaxID=2975951 RepID=UPI002DD91F5D|nr:ATP-binding protein [Streptosporangium sp. NBC_01810]WSA29203.1 ATP-binding protein [Streptosporangium sp. NBC_01810]